MNGMTLKKFFNAMIEYNEIEFTYQGIEYMYSKNSIPAQPELVEITIYSGEPFLSCQLRLTSNKNKSILTATIHRLLETPVLLDGKTIKEAESEINVTVLFG